VQTAHQKLAFYVNQVLSLLVRFVPSLIVRFLVYHAKKPKQNALLAQLICISIKCNALRLVQMRHIPQHQLAFKYHKAKLTFQLQLLQLLFSYYLLQFELIRTKRLEINRVVVGCQLEVKIT